MTSPTPRPSHQVRLEVEILTDEYALPAPPSALVLLAGADSALRDRIRGELAAYPGHVLYDAPTFVLLMERLLRERPDLADEIRRLV